MFRSFPALDAAPTHSQRLNFWPRCVQRQGFVGRSMRISDDVRECVFFIGHGDGADFRPAGTAFFVAHDGGHRYVVTARHVAEQLGDAPFAFRLNKLDGTSATFNVDLLVNNSLEWHVPDDQTIDLAVMPFSYDLRPYDVRFKVMPSDGFANRDYRNKWDIGPGDTCYAVGLFKLLYGAKRNLPVVHTGTIACLPEDEKIPINNWRSDVNREQVIYSQGFLVEMQNISGLSGAPVFVRNSVRFGLIRLATESGEPNDVIGRVMDDGIGLLGIWQGSWDAAITQAITYERGIGVRVPVGMGVVVPVDALLSLLDSPSLAEPRRLWRERQNANLAAKPD